MAHLTSDLLPMDSANPRRHTDPPNLWLTVLASSVTLHLCFVVAMLLASRFTVRIQTAAIPVEVVDVTTTPSTKTPLVQQLPTLPNNTTRPSPQTTPGSRQPTTTRPTTATRPTTVPNPNRTNSGQRSQSTPGSPFPTTTRPTAPSPAPSPRSSPLSPATPRSTTPPQTPAPNRNGNSPQNPPTRTPAPSPVSSPVPTSPPSSPGDGGITTSVPVNRNPPAPSGMSTRVEIIRLGSPQDIIDNLPQVKQVSRSYQSGERGCVSTPESRRSFGQSVEVLVTIDEKGQVEVDNTRLLETVSPDYAQLVQCLVNTWEFDPATNNLPTGQRSPIPSNIVVTVTITAAE